jgi:platelet-activating factor acetylhydrolase IB subunit beta/gamma
VVLFVGTNNHGNTAEQIAEGIEAIVEAIRKRQPQTYTIVLVNI